MTWAKILGGALLVVVGLLWILQGLNVLPGSVMSGQAMWVIIGVVVGLLGIWLLRNAARGRASAAAGK